MAQNQQILATLAGKAQVVLNQNKSSMWRAPPGVRSHDEELTEATMIAAEKEVATQQKAAQPYDLTENLMAITTTPGAPGANASASGGKVYA